MRRPREAGHKQHLRPCLRCIKMHSVNMGGIVYSTSDPMCEVNMGTEDNGDSQKTDKVDTIRFLPLDNTSFLSC